MPVLPTLQALIKRITDVVFKNDNQEIKAELHQKLLIDIVDTLWAQSGGLPNLQQVLDTGSVAVSTTDVDITKGLWRFLLGDNPVFVKDEAQSGDSFYKWTPTETSNKFEGYLFGAQWQEDLTGGGKTWQFQNDSGNLQGQLIHNSQGIEIKSGFVRALDDQLLKLNTSVFEVNYFSGLSATENLTLKSLLGKTLLSPYDKDATVPLSTLDIRGDLTVREVTEETSGSGFTKAVIDSNGLLKSKKASYDIVNVVSGAVTVQPWQLIINTGTGQINTTLDTTLGNDDDKISIIAPTGTSSIKITLNGLVFKILREGDQNMTFIKDTGRWKLLQEPVQNFEWNRTETGSSPVTADIGTGHTAKGGASPTFRLNKDTGNPTIDGAKAAFATDATSTAVIETLGTNSGVIANLPNSSSVVLRYDATDIEWYIESSHNL